MTTGSQRSVIAGSSRVAGRAGMGGGKTIPVGTKTTITINQREVSKLPDPAIDPVMDVESYKDLEPNCAAK